MPEVNQVLGGELYADVVVCPDEVGLRLSVAAAMNTRPPAVVIGPPLLGTPKRTGRPVGKPNGPFARAVPSGFCHSTLRVCISMALIMPNGGSLRTAPVGGFFAWNSSKSHSDRTVWPCQPPHQERQLSHSMIMVDIKGLTLMMMIIIIGLMVSDSKDARCKSLYLELPNV